MAAKKKKKSRTPVKAKKKAPARKAKVAKKKAAKKTAKKAPARKAAKKPAKKKKQIVGEGDYQASRAFLKDQSNFVKKNKSSIPKLAKAAERALDGPEGDELRRAEAEAGSRGRDNIT